MRVAAVVLAAGESSRMGDVKALLPLGGPSALERVVAALRAAGVDEIVVVTGYHAVQLRPELDRLKVQAAHNPHPERGMFSSIQTGVAALTAASEAFFVLPVDYALVRPAVLSALADRFAEGGADVVHPCCAGVRGHPPLLSTRLRAPLMAASPDINLRLLLETNAPQALEVEVDDLTVLMDMDGPEDLERMRRFARFVATPGEADALTEAPTLTEADALHILSLLQAPDRVVAHCRAVATVGETLAAALRPRLPELDVDLVRSACLLHDMVRVHGARRHAQMGERILRNLGMPRLAAVVGAHMVLPLDPTASPTVSEEELVYLADKMVVEDRVAGLAEREAQARAKHADDAGAPEWIARRMHKARAIGGKIETILGRDLEEIVSLRPRRVYLVRHAEPVMPEGPRRFLGQTDPPLSPHGIEQARTAGGGAGGDPLDGRLQQRPATVTPHSDHPRSGPGPHGTGEAVAPRDRRRTLGDALRSTKRESSIPRSTRPARRTSPAHPSREARAFATSRPGWCPDSWILWRRPTATSSS